MWWSRKSKPEPVGDPAVLAAAETIEPVSPHRNAYLLMGLGGAVLAAYGIAAIGSILAPVFFSLVLTICVHPLRIELEKRGVPRGLATGSVIVAVVALLGVFGYALLIALAQFGTLLPQFAPQIQEWGAQIAAWATSVGIGSTELSGLLGDFDPGAIVDVVAGLLGGVLGFTTLLVIVLTMLLLMAMDAGYIPTLLRQVQPTKPVLVAALGTFSHNVRRYMVVTTVLGVVQGVINWVALLILQVPGAFLWGMLSFLCSFIPNVGYFIAIIPPLIFGALVGGWPLALAIIVVYGVINAVIQSVIQPRVVGGAVSLSQTITFFSVLFWGLVLGPIGAILAVPATLLVRLILIDSNPRMEWLKPLIGDLGAAKQVMEAEDAQHKAERKARKSASPPAD